LRAGSAAARLFIAEIINAENERAWGNPVAQARLRSRPLEEKRSAQGPYFFAFFFFDFLKPTLPALGS
jgi:hypothetical protein